MQAQGVNWAQYLILVLAIAGLIVGYIAVNNLNNRVDNLDIPTASEIAASVKIPEITIPDTDSQQQQEIWDKVYKRQIDRFEREAIEACTDEFDFDDLEDLFGEYVDVEFIREYEDDREFNVINLGIDDEDDREAELTGVFKVRVDDDYNDLVYGTCLVTSDDGELEADLKLSL